MKQLDRLPHHWVEPEIVRGSIYSILESNIGKASAEHGFRLFFAEEFDNGYKPLGYYIRQGRDYAYYFNPLGCKYSPVHVKDNIVVLGIDYGHIASSIGPGDYETVLGFLSVPENRREGSSVQYFKDPSPLPGDNKSVFPITQGWSDSLPILHFYLKPKEKDKGQSVAKPGEKSVEPFGALVTYRGYLGAPLFQKVIRRGQGKESYFPKPGGECDYVTIDKIYLAKDTEELVKGFFNE